MIDIYNVLVTILDKENIRKNEPMNSHTSFKIGGAADFMVTPQTEDELRNILIKMKKMNQDIFIMGNGTNLLVRDKGIRGVVIKLCDNFSGFDIENNYVDVKSGILMSGLSKHIMKNSLTGFEFASGIPGTIGGAIAMNAGAYDGEMKDVIHSVRAMNMDGEIFELSNEQMKFGYRRSIITSDNLIVLSAVLKLQPGNYEDIKAKTDDFTVRRTTKQPLSAYSAGSTFKRPEGNFAGKLIQDAGLKGIMMKDAAISDLHSGFVINKGNATCQNILEFIEFIKATVYGKFEIMLEEEVKVVGEE